VINVGDVTGFRVRLLDANDRPIWPVSVALPSEGR
jgi:hypothetical protein